MQAECKTLLRYRNAKYYRFESFREYSCVAKNIGDILADREIQSEGLFLLSATNLPRYDIREEISHACVSRISRDTNELERFRSESGASHPPSSRHVSLRSPKKRAGKLPPIRSHNEGPQTCSTSSHNTWTGGQTHTHMVRSRRTGAPSLSPRCKVKLWIHRLCEMSIPGIAMVFRFLIRALVFGTDKEHSLVYETVARREASS